MNHSSRKFSARFLVVYTNLLKCSTTPLLKFSFWGARSWRNSNTHLNPVPIFLMGEDSNNCRKVAPQSLTHCSCWFPRIKSSRSLRGLPECGGHQSSYTSDCLTAAGIAMSNFSASLLAHRARIAKRALRAKQAQRAN